MHPIEIREQNANLVGEIVELVRASHTLMRAATNENPPANLAQAKAIILEVLERLPGIAMRIG